eukprot:Pgem_evm1s838
MYATSNSSLTDPTIPVTFTQTSKTDSTIPVIFTQTSKTGCSDFLKYTILQSLQTNDEVILISPSKDCKVLVNKLNNWIAKKWKGDKKTPKRAKVVWNPKWEDITFQDPYNKDDRVSVKIFTKYALPLMSKNFEGPRLSFELICWVRWFIVLGFAKESGFKKMFYADNDVLVYLNITSLYEDSVQKHIIDRKNGGTADGGLDNYDISMSLLAPRASGSTIFFNNIDAIEDMLSVFQGLMKQDIFKGIVGTHTNDMTGFRMYMFGNEKLHTLPCWGLHGVKDGECNDILGYPLWDWARSLVRKPKFRMGGLTEPPFDENNGAVFDNNLNHDPELSYFRSDKSVVEHSDEDRL